MDELTVGQRNNDMGLPDAAGVADAAAAKRDESELNNSLLLPFLFLGRVPSLDCGDEWLAMGCLRCIATQSIEICQACASTFAGAYTLTRIMPVIAGWTEPCFERFFCFISTDLYVF
jgi:hypothetical protein